MKNKKQVKAELVQTSCENLEQRKQFLEEEKKRLKARLDSALKDIEEELKTLKTPYSTAK